ncbi:MAG: hypothetical protein JWN90_291 [Parcubacteria group bacterium]|nr:hypothetical protein [Parcubacteria group bacterium]
MFLYKSKSMSMKKLYILGIIILVIILVALTYNHYGKEEDVIQGSPSTQTDHALEFNDFTKGETVLTKKQSYKDSGSDNTVILTPSKTGPNQSGNLTFEVLVNGNSAGEISGVGISQTSFSPDHKYFALRTRSILGCAGACQTTTLYAIDLSQPKVMLLLVKPQPTASNAKDFKNGEPFVDSYTWKDAGILATSFVVGFDENTGKSYRLGSKELWYFDLSNPTSIMRNGIRTKTVSE